jgi:hypothetical protein
MSQTADQIQATRDRLDELQRLDQAHRDQVKRRANPYLLDMEATSRELQRLEREALVERTRAQLRGLSAEARAHDTALKQAVFKGISELLRTLDAVDHHVTGIRTARKKFYVVLEAVVPNVTKGVQPLGPATKEEHAAALSLLRELQHAGLDLDAITSSATGYLSPFDRREMLPTGELGGELWDLYVSVKQPQQPGDLHKPRRADR